MVQIRTKEKKQLMADDLNIAVIENVNAPVCPSAFESGETAKTGQGMDDWYKWLCESAKV